MDTEETWSVIEAERRSLADLLEDLTPAQWETGSLCSEWRVRDVAAHLSLVSEPPPAARVLALVVKAGGNFHLLNRDASRDRARWDPEDIVRSLRSHAGSRKVPVVSNWQNVLFDVLVHGQDVAVPLGIDRPMDPEAARVGADRVWTMGWPFRAPRRLAGLRLEATDIRWTVGQGDLVSGPIRALLLALTGRPAALADLTGPGVPSLTERLAGRSPSGPGRGLRMGRGQAGRDRPPGP